MAAGENIWGPEFSQYSTQNFEPRLTTFSDAEVKNFRARHKAVPLQYLENTLRWLDPRDDTFDGLVSVPLSSTITRLWEYSTGSNCGAFQHYYGFLCVRHLLHATCVAIIKEANTVDKVLRSLRPGASWSDWAQAVAFEALDTAARAMKTPASFSTFRSIFAQNPTFVSGMDTCDGGLKAPLIITTLWRTRDSFLTLCSRGLLPGCAMFLLALLNLLVTHSDEDRLSTQLIYLQDLAFRLYLVGSHRDRQILQFVCMFSTYSAKGRSGDHHFATSVEDGRAIGRAYIGLFLVLEQGANTKSLPIDFACHLSNFVWHATGMSTSETIDEVIDMAHTSLRFLWLLLKDRGRIAVEEHDRVRFYAIWLFEAFGFLQSKRISTPEEQRKLAHMLAEAEIVALGGRVLLLVLEEGNEFKNVKLLDETIAEMSGLADPLNKSAAVAPELFLDSKIEWAKVFARLGAFAEMSDLKLSKEKTRYLLAMFEAWRRYIGVRRDYDDPPRMCIYPRCSQLSLTELRLVVYNVCGRCTEAVYCDLTCQTAHWKLATSESHRLECRALNG